MQVMAHYPLDSNSTFLGSGAKNACWHFLTSLKLGCHPQHDARNVVLNKCKCCSRNKYEIRKRTDNTNVAF
jgi:hypothetical protein